MTTCRRTPPLGYKCTRALYHDGPCALEPKWWNVTGRRAHRKIYSDGQERAEAPESLEKWAHDVREAVWPHRFYGDGGTIHSGGHVDIEVGPDGKVAAVWFRCETVAFQQHTVTAQRAREQATHGGRRLVGIVIEEE